MNKHKVRPIDARKFKRKIQTWIQEAVKDFQAHKLIGPVDNVYQDGNNYFADIFLNGASPKFSDSFASFSNWTTVAGAFTTANGGATSSAAVQDLAIVTSSNYSNLTFLCQVYIPTISSGTEIEIIVRYQDASNYYALVFTNNTVLLRLLSGGAATTLSSVAVNFTAGNWYWMRIQAFSSRFTAWTSATGAVGSWSAPIQATDATFSTGSVGVRDVSVAAQFKSPTVYTGVTPAIPVRPGVGATLSVGQEVFVEKINFNGQDLMVDMARVI